MSKPVQMEWTADEAMWVWRMADLMDDIAGSFVEPSEAELRLAWIARRVRDGLSAQGVSGDPAAVTA